MDKVFFKITIPNCNGMAYVKKCLDSALDQTFQDFKIIFVDDGSDDFSYEFAKMYERKRPDKLVVLRAETKRCAGGCRNIGIEHPVKCEYCCFMDSDDYLYSRDSLKILHDAVAEDRPDMLLFNWCSDYGGKIKKNRFKNFEEYAGKLASTPWNAAWARTTKAEITQKFLENCMRGEDTYQFLKTLDKKPVVKQIDDFVYVYRQTPFSAVHQPTFGQHRPIFVQALKDLRKQAVDENVVASINRRLGE